MLESTQNSGGQIVVNGTNTNQDQASAPDQSNIQQIEELLTTLESELMDNPDCVTEHALSLSDQSNTLAITTYADFPHLLLEYQLKLTSIYAKNGWYEYAEGSLIPLNQNLTELFNQGGDSFKLCSVLTLNYLIPSYLVNNTAKALEWCSKFIESSECPADGKVLYYVYASQASRLHDQENDSDRALNLARQTLNELSPTPGIATLWYTVAETYLTFQQYAEAEQSAEDGIRITEQLEQSEFLDATKIDLHLAKSTACTYQEKNTESLAELDKALALLKSSGKVDEGQYLEAVMAKNNLLFNTDSQTSVMFAFSEYNYVVNNFRDNLPLLLKISNVYTNNLTMTGQYSLALEHLKATRIWLIKSLPEELQEVFKKKKVQEFSSALDAHKLSEFDSHTTWLFRCICMTSEQILDCHLQLREDKSIKKPYYLIWQMHKISSCLTHHTAILAHAENAIYTSNFCLAFDKEKLAKVYLRSAGFILKDFSLEECPDLKCRYYTLRGIILIESNGTKDSISKASKLARSASKALEVYHDQIQYIDTNLEELLQGLRLKIAIRENDLYDSVESRSNLIDTINTLIPEGDVTSNTPSLQLIYLHGILASVYDKVYLSDKADEHRAIAEQYERDYTINNIG